MNHRKVTPDILDAFGLLPTPPAPIESGHINDTFLVKAPEGDFILQHINRYVFPNPENIMENVVGVTEFLRKKIIERGGDPRRETLTVRSTVDGHPFYQDETGEYWRVTGFIAGASSHETPENPEMLQEAGYAFGNFMSMLADYPADKLHEIIPNFHNTPKRFQNLMNAVGRDEFDRQAYVAEEIAFARAREKDCGLLMELLRKGRLPLRVTHNDTKMSNILLDDTTGKAVCVIDLDTVMPGLTAFDFGDSIRAGASTAAEDETDLSKVHFDLDRFEAYTKGFLTAAGSALTDTELRTLPDGAKLMTLEVGIRFLEDYLRGDVYFRTAYATHNLDRARNQFHLVAEMEQHRAEMDEIVQKYAKG